MSGLYQIVKAQPNGALVRMLGEQRIQMVSNTHNFSLLDAISIYTKSVDSVGLTDVLLSMEKIEKDGTPPPNANKSNDAQLHSYFALALPDYDRQRVYTGDIRKIIKWYSILRDHNALPQVEPEKTADDTPVESDNA